MFEKFFNLFRKSTRKKWDLRDVCVELYGEEFGIQYDTLARGGVIGGLATTIGVLEKIGVARSALESNDVEGKIKQLKEGDCE